MTEDDAMRLAEKHGAVRSDGGVDAKVIAAILEAAQGTELGADDIPLINELCREASIADDSNVSRIARQAAERIAALSAQPTYENGRRSMQEEAAKLVTDDTPVYSEWQAQSLITLASRIRALKP